MSARDIELAFATVFLTSIICGIWRLNVWDRANPPTKEEEEPWL